MPETLSATTPLAERAFTWRFTAPLFVGSALNPVNTSLIATALVPIAAGVHVWIGQTAALVSALYVASAIAQPTAGKAADVFGPRRVFLAGILLVLLGGLVGGFAPSLSILLISRILIGLGTSCAYPTAMVLIRRRAHSSGLDQPPGGVLGGLQIAGIATASLGLPLGGILVQLAGWRSVFFVNVPVALIALVSTLLWVPRDERDRTRSSAREISSLLDVTGIVGFAAAMSALLLFLSHLPTVNWALPATTVTLWIAEVLWELHAATPFLDVRLLFRNMALTRTYVQTPPELLGTASGLMRSFGYLGSIASSAITGIVFRDTVSDSGVTTIAWIMIGVSIILLALTVLVRRLPRTAAN